MQTNVTQLLKSKVVNDFMNEFIKKDVFKNFKFKLVNKNYNENDIKHKNYSLLGTAINYYFRYEIAKVFNLKMNLLIAEKSLYLMKIHFFDFSNKEDNLIYNTILNIIKTYKSLKLNETTFPFLCLGMVDSFYRTGYFDKYNFWLQFNQFTDYIRNKSLITPLITDFFSVKNNVNRLLFATKNFRFKTPIYLNPDLTQNVNDFLVKGDADLIVYNTIWSIKTTLNMNVPISYIRQLLLYYWLGKRKDHEKQLYYFGIINTRASNFIRFRISDVLTLEPRDFFDKLDSFLRKEFKKNGIQ